MVISDKFKLAFVHIPKTGGSTFRNILRKNDKSAKSLGAFHQPITDYAHQLTNYHKVAIVRNSWELCASCYRFESLGKPKENFMPNKNMSFYDWLLWKSEFRKPCHYPFPRQLAFLKDSDGNMIMNTIINFANFKNGVKALCDKFALKLYDDKVHYYGDYDYRSIYKSDKDIELVANICKEDIEYFEWNYED